jgi:hypothetical protein
MLKHICPIDSPCKKCERNTRVRNRYASDSSYHNKIRVRNSLAKKLIPSTEEQKKRNREYALARYHRLKDDPIFKQKEQARNKKKKAKRTPSPRRQLPFPPYKKSSRLYWKMAVGLLLERDGWNCHLCTTPMSWKNVTIDHVTPQCIEPTNHTPSNLRLAHNICNYRRGAFPVA